MKPIVEKAMNFDYDAVDVAEAKLMQIMMMVMENTDTVATTETEIQTLSDNYNTAVSSLVTEQDRITVTSMDIAN